MGGPAGMRDADLPAQAGRFGFLYQFSDLAVAAQTLQAVVVEHSDSGGVITPVFQTFQTFQQRGCHVLASRRTDNSAHQFFRGRFQPWSVFCSLRDRVSSPGGVSRVMVEPAPMVAPAPMVTGAISWVPDPTKTSSPITVACFCAPS